MNMFKRAQTLTSFLLAVILLATIPSVVFAAEDTYTVTFVIDGEEVSTQEVACGEDATLPEIPEKTGYTQIPPQWDHNGKNITADTRIEAKYTLNEYTITYKFLDGSTKVLSYLYGEQIVMLDPPVKEGFHIIWDKKVTTLTSDVVIKAIYTDPPEETPEITQQWNKNENDVWMIIILVGTAVLFAVLILLQIKKKKLDKEKND